jgi:hypothetical protein
MKRGFVFTVIFSLLFLMLLYTAIIYSDMEKARSVALDSVDSGRTLYFADDIGGDYLTLWGMSTGISREGGKIRWTVTDRIPNDIGNMEPKLSEYESFVSGEYSRVNNIRAGATLDRAGELSLSPQGLTYRHTSRSDIVLEGNALEYRISGKLLKSCGGGCTSSGSWVWGIAGDGPFVIIDMTDANGSRIDILGKTSGYVKLNQTDVVSIPVENGGVVEIRLSEGYLRMEFSNVGAETKTTLAIDGNSPVVVYAPVRLKVDERSFERIALIQK